MFVALACTVAVAACAPAGAGQEGGGAGVPLGAAKEDYVAALSDMEPVTLGFGGMTSGPNTPTVQAYVRYGELVDEWSGGKITFEFDFGGAKLTLDKMADGLGQGRMDMGTFVPAYQPDEWPVANLGASLGFIGSGSPIAGRLALLAARLDFAHSFEPLVQEMTEGGIVATMPIFQNNEARMHCVSATPLQSLADLAGKRIRVADSGQARMAEAIGMVPVSMVNAEMYQGLQRGVVDCAVNGVSAGFTGGYYDVVSSWTLENEELVWTQTATAWGFGESMWNELPLAARQLLWDTLPQLIEGQVEASFGSTWDSLVAARDQYDVAVGEYGADVMQVAAQQHEEEKAAVAGNAEQQGVTDDGAALVARYEDAYDRWYTIVTEELGYTDTVTWGSYADEFDPATFDARPLADRMYEEILLPKRPA
ncbi:hypothetical protein [Pseudonocardia kunmingensis]|uniref:hypothetical protein n=1 Tax=Pseudonocardia kunmingensis TaxID=630975 RepID=UPI001478AC1A|nr:hypothetical protein [Pseudonocardia kunmingensis]